MSPYSRDALESSLQDLFDRQARSVAVHERSFSVDSIVNPIGRRRHRIRPVLAGVASIAVVAALVAGLLIARTGSHQTSPGAGPGVASAPPGGSSVTFETPQVSLRADDLEIDVAGLRFTTAQSKVALNSDPGDPTYWTLEATWPEHGVEMRFNIYFTSDGRDWWANEIRTYNGQANGDWIIYTGVYLREPLGQAFTGNLDLSDQATGDSLHLHGLRVSTSPQRFDCRGTTARFTIVHRLGGPSFDLQANTTLEGEEVRLLDTRSCSIAAEDANATFEWSSADPSVVTPTATNCVEIVNSNACTRGAYMNLNALREGSTTLQLTARDAGTGQTIAHTDFPVVVHANPGT